MQPKLAVIFFRGLVPPQRGKGRKKKPRIMHENMPHSYYKASTANWANDMLLFPPPSTYPVKAALFLLEGHFD